MQRPPYPSETGSTHPQTLSFHSLFIQRYPTSRPHHHPHHTRPSLLLWPSYHSPGHHFANGHLLHAAFLGREDVGGVGDGKLCTYFVVACEYAFMHAPRAQPSLRVRNATTIHRQNRFRLFLAACASPRVADPPITCVPPSSLHRLSPLPVIPKRTARLPLSPNAFKRLGARTMTTR